MSQVNHTDKTSEKALSALAFLEANRQISSNTDRLEYFMPLVEETISNLSNVAFSLDDLQEMLESSYQIKLPETILSTLALRCCRKQFLKKENNKYHRTEKPMSYSASTKRRSELEEQVASLLDSAEQYAKSTGQIVDGHVDGKTLRASLLSFIDAGFGDTSFSQSPDLQQSTSEQGGFFADFVSSQHSKDASIMSTIGTIARGAIIRDAAFFPGLITEMQSFRGLIVYLDSHIVCWCLGMSTVEDERYANEALAILRKSGVVYEVLTQTVDEIHGILYAIESKWEYQDLSSLPQSYSRCMKRRGLTKDAVFELRNSLKERIDELGLRVVDSQPRDGKYVAGEEELAEKLRDRNDPQGSWSPRVQHDVNCIAEVLGMRGGAEPRKIGDAKALFVTVSSGTIRSINRWWHEDEGHSELVIPPVLHFRNLTNYVWLSNPSEGFEQIGNASVLITCATIMAPSEPVWNAYISRLREMVENGSMTRERAQAIIQQNDLQSILKKEEDEAKETDIDNDTFFNDVTDKVIQSISRPALANQEKNHRSEIERIDAKHKEEMDAANAQANSERARADKLEEQINETEEKRKVVAEKKSKHIATILTIVAAVAYVGIVFVVMRYLTNDFKNDGSFNNSFIISCVLTIALAFAGICFDFTVFRKSIEKCIMKRLLI